MRASDTQRESYAAFKASGKPANEKRIVLGVMKKLTAPVTRLQLSQITGLPQNHLTRVLYDLRYPKSPKEPQVEVVFKAKCSTTRVNVHHYQIIQEGGTDD